MIVFVGVGIVSGLLVKTLLRTMARSDAVLGLPFL